MAAPESKHMQSITGTWQLNRQLSDDPDATLAMQGVPWAIRKALGIAGVTVHISQVEAEDGTITALKSKQVVHPGGFVSDDNYILDNEDRESTVPILGTIVVRCVYTPVDDLQDADLRGRLAESGAAKVVLQEFAHSKDNNWSSVATWGFQEIEGNRYFTRTSTISNKKGKKVETRLVYDFKED